MQANVVCGLAQSWPNEVVYSLTDQARRVAASVHANLAEGLCRGTVREVARSAQIALGSLCELDTMLHLASDPGHGSEGEVVGVSERLAIGETDIQFHQLSGELQMSNSPTTHYPLWTVLWLWIKDPSIRRRLKGSMQGGHRQEPRPRVCARCVSSRCHP